MQQFEAWVAVGTEEYCVYDHGSRTMVRRYTGKWARECAEELASVLNKKGENSPSIKVATELYELWRDLLTDKA